MGHTSEGRLHGHGSVCIDMHGHNIDTPLEDEPLCRVAKGAQILRDATIVQVDGKGWCDHSEELDLGGGNADLGALECMVEKARAGTMLLSAEYLHLASTVCLTDRMYLVRNA